MHRRHLLPVELGIVVLVEEEQLDDRRREPRDAAQLPGIDRIDDVDDLGRRNAHRLADEARIGDVARMAAEEVIGDAPADAVELDALADDVAAGAAPRCGSAAASRTGIICSCSGTTRPSSGRRGRKRKNTSPAMNTSRAARRCWP